MFRPMRRKAQSLMQEEIVSILQRQTYGTLSLCGDDGYPYSVPMNYAYDGDRIIFHSALSGHKIDSIRRCPKASFSVVDSSDVIAEEYTTAYRSVILFGCISFLEGDEKREAAKTLAVKFFPSDDPLSRDAYIDSHWPHLCVFVLEVEHMSGKQGLELMKEKPQEK